jgi:hypothetical protein
MQILDDLIDSLTADASAREGATFRQIEGVRLLAMQRLVAGKHA